MGRRVSGARVLVVLMLAAAGCAGARLEGGVFTSSKGYQVDVPGGAWTAATDSHADLELRHRDGSAGIVVNASCGAARSEAPLAVLARHLLAGVRERSVVSRDDVAVNGRTTQHAVIDGRVGAGGVPVRLEVYVMRDERCLYDLVYAASPETFAVRRADFERVVRTFRTGAP